MDNNGPGNGSSMSMSMTTMFALHTHTHRRTQIDAHSLVVDYIDERNEHRTERTEKKMISNERP